MLVRSANGREEAYDLVVGEDGAWSRVRPAVSPVTPHHTGVTSVETPLDDVGHPPPGLARLVGDGSLAVYGVNRALVAQCDGGGHVTVYARFRAPLDGWSGADGDTGAVRAGRPVTFDGWAAPVPGLPRHGTAFARRPLYVLPESHTWDRRRGDAAGRRRPSDAPLGAGANLAMLEGAELAETLAAGPRTWTGPSAPSRSGRGRGPRGGRGSRRPACTAW
ncbi:hypothetical protein GCM10010259_52520 [Streptomyces daghestanicus]|uniref:Uncharacterized protein n=1 Tax=Streptomyces daghestanicus TaxID=66885 RepID=A0ABQ3Q4R8_9ACTN|nr:hypothetical protein GCM10010259_52520 [Streptomyces daghestanicus]GHI32287.1 hypothetical protein Sdagh_40170 [Streptomyces daghestanicus]